VIKLLAIAQRADDTGSERLTLRVHPTLVYRGMCWRMSAVVLMR